MNRPGQSMAYVNKSQTIRPASRNAPTAEAKQRQSNQNTPLPLSRYSRSSSVIRHLKSESVLLLGEHIGKLFGFVLVGADIETVSVAVPVRIYVSTV